MSTTEKPTLAARPGQAGIDPRGPRFGAGITAVLLLTVIAVTLGTLDPSTTQVTMDDGRPNGESVTWNAIALVPFSDRLVLPSTLLFAVLVALFAWGAFAGIQRHPYGLVFKKLIRPRLAAPTELEDPAPPTFAQGVGFVITLTGLVLHVSGVPYALVIAASAAFIAAFLNSVFGYCLGCQIYLLLVRAGIIRRKGATTA